MGALVGYLLTTSLLVLYHLRGASGVSDDSKEYLKLGRGELAEGPFGRRWLAPLLCGEDLDKWKALTAASLVASSTLIGALWGWEAAILFNGLTALARIPMVIPVLVDAPSFCFALLSTVAPFPLNVVCAIVSGAFKETGPVFAAAWSLNPLLLLGLLGVDWFHRKAPSEKPWLGPPHTLPALAIPFHPWLYMDAMLLPWGAMALLVPVGLGLGAPGAEAALLSLCLGYGSLLLAVDRARLYEWAAPALFPVALACPAWLIYPLLLPHMMNTSKEV